MKNHIFRLCLIIPIAAIMVMTIDACSLKCVNDVNSYNEGYNAGTLMNYRNEYNGCSYFLDFLKEQQGKEYSQDCFCNGFDDGYEGDEHAFGGKADTSEIASLQTKVVYEDVVIIDSVPQEAD